MPRVKTFDEQEVLNKAMHLFWKQGYAATSIQDLVNHLGINRASLYDTYGGKEQLFIKSFALYRTTSIKGIKEFFNSRPDVKQGFRELFENAINEDLQDSDKKGCFVVNSTTELIPNHKNFDKILEQNKEVFESLFLEYLQRGKENGQLSTNQELASIARFLYTFYNGIRVVSKVNPIKKSLIDSVQIALSVLY